MKNGLDQVFKNIVQLESYSTDNIFSCVKNIFHNCNYIFQIKCSN